MKTIMGDRLDGEAEARWDKLSSADKMVLMRAKTASLTKAAQPSVKPENWDRLSNLDKAQWFYNQKRGDSA